MSNDQGKPQGGAETRTVPPTPAEVARAELAKRQAAATEEGDDASGLASTEETHVRGSKEPGGEGAERDLAEGGERVHERGPGREAAGEEAAEGEAPEGEGEEGEPAPAQEEVTEPQGTFTLRLPPRGTEPGMELELEGLTDDEIEGLRRRQNEGMRRHEYEQAMAGVQQLQDAVEQVTTWMASDPVGYVLEQMPSEHYVPLALSLIFENAQVYEEIVGRLEKAESDPNALEAARARLALENRDRADKAKAALADADRYRRNYAEVKQAILAALSPDLPDADFSDAYDLAELVLHSYVTRTNQLTLDPNLVRPILEKRPALVPFLKGTEPPARKGTTGPSSAVPPAGVPATSPPVENAGPTLQAASARRRAVTTSAPPGGGPAPVIDKIPDHIRSPREIAKHLLERYRRGR